MHHSRRDVTLSCPVCHTWQILYPLETVVYDDYDRQGGSKETTTIFLLQEIMLVVSRLGECSMEEAIVDVALDLNLLPSETAFQTGVREDRLTDNRDQAQFLANVQRDSQASRGRPHDRAARIEALRLSIASGTYQVDSAELAQCILRNSTRFLETGLALSETS